MIRCRLVGDAVQKISSLPAAHGLTRSLLRPTTLSPASRKEGKMS